MSAFVDTAPALVNATRFRAAHAADWDRLERLVAAMERGSVRSLDDDDLLVLPLLYRSALSSLSVARETSLDRALISYLEQLCTRAYFQVYGVPTPAGRQLLGFFARGWPLAIQSIWRETLVAALLMLAGTVVGFLLVTGDPSWYYSIIPAAFADGRDPSASAETLRAMLYDGGGGQMLAGFATALFTHNAQIAIFAFALGFAFGLPSVLLIIYNGLMLGAMLSIYVAKGLGAALGGWLIIHGSTELFAIAVAGGAGMRIGMAIAFPGRLSRARSIMQAGRSAAVAMGGAVVMLAVAGLLEGIGRQTVTADATRYTIGLAMLAGWLVYFYAPRRRGDALAVRAP